MEKVFKYSVFCDTLNKKLTMKKNFSTCRLLILDVVLTYYLYKTYSPDFDSTVGEFWRQTAVVAENLNGVGLEAKSETGRFQTITWLRSNPAGLKLNTPVNETLATFFTYHIYLWTTFIGFLHSDAFFRVIFYSACAGFSTFAAIIHDFSQVFFLHFNCFDAYATKLCYLCYYTLTVLWGLVMGKKWNPLRKRTDTVTLDTRQQFLATSLFVIILFILPTILVYFIVFRCLRYAVSALQLILYAVAVWTMKVHELQVYLTRKGIKEENEEKQEK